MEIHLYFQDQNKIKICYHDSLKIYREKNDFFFIGGTYEVYIEKTKKWKLEIIGFRIEN